MTQPDPLPPGHLPYAGYATPGNYDWDRDHLRILSILHYVWGGIVLLFSSFFILYAVMGLMLANGSFPHPVTITTTTTGPTTLTAFTTSSTTAVPPPAWAGYFVAGVGGCGVVAGWTLGVLTIVSGVKMGRRRSRVFSMVVAALNCVSIPFGTTLGVFTLIVLARGSVKAAYAAEPTFA